MRTAHSMTQVTDESTVYSVLDEENEVIWHRVVIFGHDRDHRTGGSAFQEAARAQEAAARSYAEHGHAAAV